MTEQEAERVGCPPSSAGILSIKWSWFVAVRSRGGCGTTANYFLQNTRKLVFQSVVLNYSTLKDAVVDVGVDPGDHSPLLSSSMLNRSLTPNLASRKDRLFFPVSASLAAT